MPLSTPDLHLQTLFVLNGDGRIVSTREPGATPGPLFTLIRGRTTCAWAVRSDIPTKTANELDRLAQQEHPLVNFRDEPVHAERYRSLLLDGPVNPESVGKINKYGGPAFTFPDTITVPDDVIVIEEERSLQRNFNGWIVGEIAAGRSPVMAIISDGYPVSICFCARTSDEAAEAGLETAEAFRGYGFGPRVTAAWALAIRESGRIPLYSTSWTNDASLAVARKLGLIAYE